ncbi:MAG: hypothetical protein ABJD97_10960 [Betaproteobacteria bacterium]
MKATPFWRLWGGPIAIAFVTAIGLVGGLVGDGAWDGLAWIGLGIPAGAVLWFGLRRRGGPR